MGFKQIKERATFLRNLLELPPLKKRINEMRLVTVMVVWLLVYCCPVVENRDVCLLLCRWSKNHHCWFWMNPLLEWIHCFVKGVYVCVCVYKSIFYCSVWQYIGELTVAKQCTVVITTHYIDEARRANTVSNNKCCVNMWVVLRIQTHPWF